MWKQKLFLKIQKKNESGITLPLRAANCKNFEEWLQSGFTLLEILIAVAILASSFLALLSAQGTSFRASERAERLTQATLLAQSKMVELEMELDADLAKNKFPSDDEEKTGTFDEPFEDYRFKYTLKKVEIPVPPQGEGEAEGEGRASSNILIGNYIKNVTEQISKSVREVQLTIFWGDKDRPEEEQPHFVLTTHWVKLK